jgi:sulfonate transport system substrate-binding protein
MGWSEMSLRRGSWAMVALAAVLLALTPARAEPVKIRVGWVAVIANLPSILFLKDGLARHQGSSYVMEPIHFASTPTMIPALASNDLDIAALSYSAFALAIENGGMKDLRAIADEFQDGVEGYYTNEFMVLKESPIRTIDDLKGKILASNGAGGAVDMALRVLLRRHGLEDKRDFTIIEVSSPNQRAMLAERKVDLITSATPFSQDPDLRRIARTLFTQRAAVGGTQMILWAARSGFLARNRAAVVDFLEDTIRARRYWTDPANHKEAVELVAAFTKQAPERLDPWLFTKSGDYYRDPDDRPDLAALQHNVDMQAELGFLNAKLDIGAYADLGPVNEAAARIDRVQPPR